MALLVQNFLARGVTFLGFGIWLTAHFGRILDFGFLGGGVPRNWGVEPIEGRGVGCRVRVRKPLKGVWSTKPAVNHTCTKGDLAGRFLPSGTKNLVHYTDTGGRLDRCIIHANPQPRVFWYIRLELALKAKYPCVDQRMLHATADWMSGLYSHGKLQ